MKRLATLFWGGLCVGVLFADTLDADLIQTSGQPSVGSDRFYGYRLSSPAEGPGSNAFSNAYEKAMAEGVPLVVVWSDDSCEHCGRRRYSRSSRTLLTFPRPKAPLSSSTIQKKRAGTPGASRRTNVVPMGRGRLSPSTTSRRTVRSSRGGRRPTPAAGTQTRTAPGRTSRRGMKVGQAGTTFP